ncbi:XkdF-like putative serine protease domain-containing protein [Bacillus swezeyi]|uniref:Phage portal protein n=1 Tax=Bacillus swezeyi TaxID=1925020 RepID=A0A5M8RX38_9BACI|nr:XkdF-like putative serine protease domain-containing protein [Bacillus swezeyi]KAA6453215.1 phage portal protein [Bacillus swezeyi]KAA6476167.1 phage portal protein [Bacillus swezeyi]TYS38585.1 phage portal protein [Bacillus swezeyi]
MPRELKNAKINFVSYVDKAANKKKFFLTKSSGPPTFQKEVKLITKAEGEKKLVYGVVYEPNVMDAHSDFMTAEEIQKAAHGFLKDARKIDKDHNFQGGVGEVVESYVAPADFEVNGETIVKGSWVLVTKACDEVWEQIKKGEITGYSMAGTAETLHHQSAADRENDSFFQLMKQFFARDKQKKGEEEKEMKRTEVQGTIEAVLAPLLKRLDALEENTDANDKHDQTQQDAHLKEVIQEMLEPLISRIEALEKMRGGSKQTEDEKGGAEEVKKSIWSGLL